MKRVSIDVGGTNTDAAVAAGIVALGDATAVTDLGGDFLARWQACVARMLADAVDRVKTQARAVPVIAVGGGTFLVPDRMAGMSDVLRVDHSPVANAIGAAIAEISVEIDQVFTGHGRDAAIAEAIAAAERRAVESGADPATLQTVEVEDIPLAYLPGDSLRVRVRVRVVGAIVAG